MRFVSAIALALVLGTAAAQEYPNKPIRVLVPFAPGGAVDTTARVLAQAMEQRVKWHFVIENRPGGNGFIATTAVKTAAPDGYTLLMAHTGEFAVNPALFDNASFLYYVPDHEMTDATESLSGRGMVTVDCPPLAHAQTLIYGGGFFNSWWTWGVHKLDLIDLLDRWRDQQSDERHSFAIVGQQVSSNFLAGAEAGR